MRASPLRLLAVYVRTQVALYRAWWLRHSAVPRQFPHRWVTSVQKLTTAVPNPYILFSTTPRREALLFAISPAPHRPVRRARRRY